MKTPGPDSWDPADRKEADGLPKGVFSRDLSLCWSCKTRTSPFYIAQRMGGAYQRCSQCIRRYDPKEIGYRLLALYGAHIPGGHPLYGAITPEVILHAALCHHVSNAFPALFQGAHLSWDSSMWLNGKLDLGTTSSEHWTTNLGASSIFVNFLNAS